jgi:hypothetical protein
MATDLPSSGDSGILAAPATTENVARVFREFLANPGVTLTEEIQLSDYKRKWNFIVQMRPDLPAELAKGKEEA